MKIDASATALRHRFETEHVGNDRLERSVPELPVHAGLDQPGVDAYSLRVRGACAG
jgi:hypothetical protein